MSIMRLDDAQSAVILGANKAKRLTLLYELRAVAQEQANRSGEPVEIFTSEGDIVDVVVPTIR
jgi:hypothetical protein